MVLLGKTNTPELGWKGDSGNRVTGPTHNPWRHGRTPGGSSGGAAAAVVAGLGPLSQGTDGAGSIRIPAGLSGAFGFKPTWGSVPQFPASVVQALSHAGPITRTVGYAVMMLQAMAGADERDRSSMQPEPVTLTDIEDGIAGIRVASESAGSMAHRTCHVVYRFRRLLSRQFLCCARSTDARTGGRHRAGVRFQWCRCGRCLHPAQRLLRIVACFSSDLRSCADTNAAVNGF